MKPAPKGYQRGAPSAARKAKKKSTTSGTETDGGITSRSRSFG